MLDYLYIQLNKIKNALRDSLYLNADELQRLETEKAQILLEIQEAKQC